MRFSKTRSAAIAIVLATFFPAASFLAADGMPVTDPALTGAWRWEKAETPESVLEPLSGQEYTVVFSADGTLHMRLEINRVNGTYEADGQSLTVRSPMASTLAAWRPDSPAPALLLLFENATNYFFRDGRLFVDTFADGGTLQFSRE